MPFPATCGPCASAARRCTTCSCTTPATGSTDAACGRHTVDAGNRAVLPAAEPDCRRTRIAAVVLGSDRLGARTFVQGRRLSAGRISRVLLPWYARPHRPVHRNFL